MPNKGHQGAQILAAEQARKKSAELTKAGVLSMQVVINHGEPSPELNGGRSSPTGAGTCWRRMG